MASKSRGRRARAGIMLRIASALLLACLGGAGHSAGQVPTFRTATRLVQINVIVHDKNGPVSNLTKEDFVLTDRGKPQTIGVFSVDSRDAARDAQPLPENTFSNRRHNGTSSPNGVTIVLLDRLNTLTGSAAQPYENDPTWIEDHALANAKQQLLKFVDELAPQDHVAIYSLGESLSVLCDFTFDRQELKSILTKYRATSVTSREEVDPRSVHTPVPGDFNAKVDGDRRVLASLANAKRREITFAALLGIAAHAANIPGRKNLVWLTANLPFSGVDIARALGRANIAIYPVDARGLLTRALPLGQRNDSSALAGYLRLSPGAESGPTGLNTMQELADETGGRAFVNTNDLSSAIRKAVEDAAVTYTLGFYPDGDSLDGKLHELKVHVNRAGVEVRYPKSYLAVKDRPAEKQSSFQAVAQSPLESAAIQILARVERADKPKSKTLRIACSLDIRSLQLAESGDTRKGSVEIYVLQQDATGQVIDKLRDRLNLQLTKENYLAYLKSGVFFHEDVQAKEGLTTLRVVVGDPGSGMVGSLIIPVTQIK
jgi:VWFA-related protein